MITPRSLALAVVAATVSLIASPAAAQSSWGIGVMRNGSVVFCDRVRSTVWIVTPTGDRSPAIDATSCHAIATGLDGIVMGESTPVDITTTRGVGVWRLDSSGRRAWVQPQSLLPNPGIWIARDTDGGFYSWTGVGAGSPDSAIVRQDPSGIRVDIAGGPRGQADGLANEARFDNVTGLAAAPDRSLLVIDNGNIRRITPSGMVVTEARGVVTDSHIGLVNAIGLWAREVGIAADRRSEAVVVDPDAGRVIHVDRGGHAVTMWQPTGWAQRLTGGRWGWKPSGVALLDDGYYVLDEWVGPVLIADIVGSPRVMHVTNAGQVSRIASVPGWTARFGLGLLVLVFGSFVWRRSRRAT
jgi:hypothetical protein